MNVKLLLDENLSPWVAETLRKDDGVDAVHREEQRRRDVALVEDFPLHAEEETPQFRDLKFTLELRALRAHEHWKGNTKVTLADLIYGLVERMQTSNP